jgi:LysR family transcriptional regulator, transcriptional activator of nhaA
MEWLNYHHLRYFYVVAKEGSLAKAAEKLKISQPSISAQLADLEEALGVPLFRRSGRSKVLTEDGQLVLGYAEEIIQLGQELLNAVKSRPSARAVRLYVGVTDSFPKLLTNGILQPVFSMAQPVHIVCREGKMEDLLAQLATHRLDLVLADEPAPASGKIKTFNHPLGDCGISFCAVAPLAQQLKGKFPRSLDGAPALLPTENTGLRRSLEKWFHDICVRPTVVAEFEDQALMKAMAASLPGFIAVPTQVAAEAMEHYGLQLIGTTEKCRAQFFAITAERRLHHPAVLKITDRSRRADKAPGK